MREAFDGIKKVPHPEEAAKRPSRRTHGAHHIDQAYLFAAECWERQLQPALRLAPGVIDHDDMAATILTGPGRSDKAIRCPVVGPGRHWLDLRPASVAEGARFL